MSEALIRCSGLHKVFETGGARINAVAGLDLEVAFGEFLAIMGPSGSGKSTLMYLLGLMDQPDAGQYLFDGMDVTQLSSEDAAKLRNQRVGFVFQSFNLLPRRTAVENVELPLVYAGIAPKQRRARALAALEGVGLGARLHHWPHQLSGGERQRVAVARALIANPPLLLADEPTGALDTQTGREIVELLLSLNRAGRTILVVTHDADVAVAAGRVLRMRDGRIVEDLPRRPLRPDQPDATPCARRHRSTIVPARTFLNAADSVNVALRALRANALRSALTTLGIVIGVAAVITMAAVGSGASLQITEQLRSLGTNLLLVQPGSAAADGMRLGDGTAMPLTEGDAAALSEVPGVQVAAAGVAGTAQLIHGNRNWVTTVGGVTPAYLVARDWRIERGRAFSPQEVTAAEKVVVLGAATTARLFEEADPLGRQLRIGTVPFTVVGVLARKGQSSASGRDQDDVALLPLSTAKMRVFGRYSQLDRQAVDYVLLKVESGQKLDAVAAQATALLRQRRRIPPHAEDNFVVGDPAAAVQTQAAATRTLSILLSAISAVALLVGGISIMNIMIVAVSERTREIGVRRAVGARPSDVRTQFLIEASALCLLGGAIGLLLGGIAAWSVAAFLGWPVFLGPGVIVLAVGSATATGVFFGLYPAAKAARLDPIEALRFE